MSADDVARQVIGRKVTVTMADGRSFPATVTQAVAERNVELVPPPLTLSNFDQPYDPTPHWNISPAKMTITLEVYEGNLDGTASS